MTGEAKPAKKHWWTALLARAAQKPWWMALLASVFTGAEGYVYAGYSLPGSDSIPIPARMAVYMVVMGGGSFLRWWLLRNPGSSDA